MPKGIGWDDPQPLVLPGEEEEGGSPSADNDVSTDAVLGGRGFRPRPRGAAGGIGTEGAGPYDWLDGAAAEKPRRGKKSSKSSPTSVSSGDVPYSGHPPLEVAAGTTDADVVEKPRRSKKSSKSSSGGGSGRKPSSGRPSGEAGAGIDAADIEKPRRKKSSRSSSSRPSGSSGGRDPSSKSSSRRNHASATSDAGRAGRSSRAETSGSSRRTKGEPSSDDKHGLSPLKESATEETLSPSSSRSHHDQQHKRGTVRRSATAAEDAASSLRSKSSPQRRTHAKSSTSKSSKGGKRASPKAASSSGVPLERAARKDPDVSHVTTDPYAHQGGKEKAATNKKESPNTSLEIWTENGSADIESAIRPARGSLPPPGRQDAKKGGGAKGGAAPGPGDATVSCCGTAVNKRHLIVSVLVCLLIAGGAVAAMLVTGIIGGENTVKEESSLPQDPFALLTMSPTASLAQGGTLSPVATPAVVAPTSRAPRPTPRPTISPRPTITAAPTLSCTESSELFKYFDDDGEVITSSCKKLSLLSIEGAEEKCGRVIVFGGGATVRTYCPRMCGGCDGTGPPTYYPTSRPTKEPTAEPTAELTNDLTPEPTAKPQADPTPRPVEPAPVAAVDPSAFSGHETFSFYVMGDIPYMYREELTLMEQLQDQTAGLADDDAVFQVHVGDIQNPSRSQCEAARYSTIAGYFLDYAALPTLMLPGDNDWNDCPNPDVAWVHWTSNFVPFETNWADRSTFPSTVERQDVQPENFAFTRAGILFLGLNLVGGSTNLFVTEADWDLRIDRDILWATQYISRYQVGTNPDRSDPNFIRAVVMFGHSPRARRFNNFLKDRLMGTGIPVVYLHGNGHEYSVARPFLDKGWADFWQVQVDQGANAPPAKVTVRGTTAGAMQLPMTVDGGQVFHGFIKFDRRGGLYPEAGQKQAEQEDPSWWGGP